MPENAPANIDPVPSTDGQIQEAPEEMLEARAFREGECSEQDRFLPVRRRTVFFRLISGAKLCSTL